MNHFISVTVSLVVALLFAQNSAAIEPGNVLIIANKEIQESIELARYYAKVRNIPEENILAISLITSEEVSRLEYKRLHDTIASFVIANKSLRKTKKKITTIVLMYGVPLRVMPSPPDWMEQEQVKLLKEKIAEIKTGEDGQEQLKKLQRQLSYLLHSSEVAAVDSELSLLHVPRYSLRNWIENPLLKQDEDQKSEMSAILKGAELLIVARLDGPDPQTVRRMIDDTVFAEKNGIKGKAYFDARWPEKQDIDSKSSYARYDKSLYRAARQIGRAHV